MHTGTRSFGGNHALLTKFTKLATELCVHALPDLGYASKAGFREQKLTVLRAPP